MRADASGPRASLMAAPWAYRPWQASCHYRGHRLQGPAHSRCTGTLGNGQKARNITTMARCIKRCTGSRWRCQRARCGVEGQRPIPARRRTIRGTRRKVGRKGNRRVRSRSSRRRKSRQRRQSTSIGSRHAGVHRARRCESGAWQKRHVQRSTLIILSRRSKQRSVSKASERSMRGAAGCVGTFMGLHSIPCDWRHK